LEIDPEFDVPREVLHYGDSVYWNAEKRWRISDSGEFMAISPNANIHLLYYRGDPLAPPTI
jgi:multiple sugar transport system substrate-binding protein